MLSPTLRRKHPPSKFIKMKGAKNKDKKKERAGSESMVLSKVWKNPFAKSHRQVKIEDLSARDVIIGVMGPTGSGKSSFIEMATGAKDMAGHTLKSCTSKISVIRFSVPEILDSDICLVDTPGFDDTNTSDVDIFTMISDWLNDTYKRKIPLAGLLYFHRITDNRMAGTPLKNLRLFENLCGKEFSTIVLTTTMWDEVELEVGALREQELQEVYWSSMINRGSTVKRFLSTPASAFDVLRPILSRANENQSLLLQKEMTDLGMKLKETVTGRALALQLEELVPKQQRLLTAIRNDLMEPTLRPDQLEKLQQNYQEVSAQLQRVMKDVERLKISVGERFLNVIKVKNWKGIWSMFRSKKQPRQRASLLPLAVMDQTLASTGKIDSEDGTSGDHDSIRLGPQGSHSASYDPDHEYPKMVFDKESEIIVAEPDEELAYNKQRTLDTRAPEHLPSPQGSLSTTQQLPTEYIDSSPKMAEAIRNQRRAGVEQLGLPTFVASFPVEMPSLKQKREVGQGINAEQCLPQHMVLPGAPIDQTVTFGHTVTAKQRTQPEGPHDIRTINDEEMPSDSKALKQGTGPERARAQQLPLSSTTQQRPTEYKVDVVPRTVLDRMPVARPTTTSNLPVQSGPSNSLKASPSYTISLDPPRQERLVATIPRNQEPEAERTRVGQPTAAIPIDGTSVNQGNERVQSTITEPPLPHNMMAPNYLTDQTTTIWQTGSFKQSAPSKDLLSHDSKVVNVREMITDGKGPEQRTGQETAGKQLDGKVRRNTGTGGDHKSRQSHYDSDMQRVGQEKKTQFDKALFPGSGIRDGKRDEYERRVGVNQNTDSGTGYISRKGKEIERGFQIHRDDQQQTRRNQNQDYAADARGFYEASASQIFKLRGEDIIPSGAPQRKGNYGPLRRDLTVR